MDMKQTDRDVTAFGRPVDDDWNEMLTEIALLRAKLAEVKAVLAEDYHPGKSDDWWDGYTELGDRLAALFA